MTIEIQNLENIIPSELMDSMSQSAVDGVLSMIADAARNEWIKLAGETLFTTRRDYINGIQPVEMQSGQAIIMLVGELPNIVEHGLRAMDLHDTLLGPNVPVAPVGKRGKHKKVDGSGYYRAIPFRHAAPTSGGATGMPMGRPYGAQTSEEDAKRMGKHVYSFAKKLRARLSTPGEGMSWDESEQEKLKPMRLPEGLVPKLKEHHKVDIYAGMVRERKTYLKATQSQYYTFRTISTGSPGWRRRDTTPGVALTERVAKFVSGIAVKSFQAYVEGLSG